MKTEEKLMVEVWSDVVCPFCYIGKRNYEKALAQWEHADEVVLLFRSFQLNPDFDPSEAGNLKEELAKKYRRSPQQIDAMLAQTTAMAKEAGLIFHLDKAVSFNTFSAHRLVQRAKEVGLSNPLEEALFAAYFTEGKDLGNPEVLQQTALAVGLSREDIQKALTGDDYAYRVNQDIHEAANLGIRGVPFFVFDRKYGVSGAQPPEVFLDTLDNAYKDWSQRQHEQIASVQQGPSCDTEGNCL